MQKAFLCYAAFCNVQLSSVNFMQLIYYLEEN